MKRLLLRALDAILLGARPDGAHPVRLRHRQLRRSLLVIMLLITLIPLTVTATLSFYQYRKLLNDETYGNARWSAESARQTIEAFIGKLQAAILVLSEAYDLAELSDQDKLLQVFMRLKAEHRGVVDLSVIGPDGIQRAYVGPYNLTGKDYSDAHWFNNALAKRVYVSEVFMGFRNIPHFVVAVSRHVQDGPWVLRASIDADTLDRFLASVDNENTDDVFLVNASGVLQSSSRYQDKSARRVLIKDLPKKKGITIVDETRGDTPVLRALGYISGTPWLLVLDQKGYVGRKNWLSFTTQLLAIFLLCVLVSGLFIFRISAFLSERIREADEAKEAALGQSEHTNRLASIGRLAGGVAHEINNPLAIINEKAGLLEDILSVSADFPDKARFLRHIASMRNAVERTRGITHRLLGFARRMDAASEPVGINDVIREVLSFLEKEALYRNIGIELRLQEDLPDVKGDYGQLQQVFLNIINNAMDAVSEQGRIEIASVGADGLVRVDVSDNGPGIPPEVQKNIFEPFFTTKAGGERPGTGLGLFITYGIVKRLGGDISLTSKGGEGTTFHVSFPAIH